MLTVIGGNISQLFLTSKVVSRISQRVKATALHVFMILLFTFFSFHGTSQTTQTFNNPGTYTFTVPAGVTEITVECWGGGGSGGGNISNKSRGGGGGAGGSYAKSILTVADGEIVIGATYNIVVGDQMNGVNSSGQKGNPSYFGDGTLVYAEGGNGGAAPDGKTVSGGQGSVTSSVGDVVYRGGNGANGSLSMGGAGGGGAGSLGVGGDATGTTAGTGTSLDGGNGGAGRTNEGNGNDGSSYGGGGGGAYISDNTNHSGGDGAQGLVKITYTITIPPSCVTSISPADGETNFAVDGTLSWNATAGASGYYLYFGTDAGATNIENGTDLGNVTSYTPSLNLDFLTDYYWKVVPYNTFGSASGCSTWNFTTADISYCNVDIDPATSVFPISRVIFNSIDNSSSASANEPVYEDFTSILSSVVQGNNYTISVEGNAAGDLGSYTFYYSAFIDWNQDGDFSDAGETYQIGTITNSNGTDGVQTYVSIPVPSIAPEGITRMRIVGQFYSYPSSCGNLWYGQAEDYTLNIIPPCNMAIQNVTGGGSYCSGGSGVEIGLDDSETGVTYELYLDGSATGNVVSGTGSAISFGTQTLAGTYTVIGYNVSDDCDLIMSGQAEVIILSAPGIAENPLPANGTNDICFAGEGEVTSISWDAVADATSYDIYFGAGGLPGIVTANVATTSYFTGTLDAGTTYYWKIVPKNSCGGATGESTWTFTTAGSPCYCSAGSTAYDLYESITNVTFAGINNSSSASKTTGYTDYTASVIPAEVMLGQSYPIAVTDEFVADQYGGYCKVYIDLNQNGVFDETSELMFGSSYTGNQTMSGSVLVPLTAHIGLTRMRVVIEGDAGNTGALPCGSFTWGEVEDYAVKISSPCASADIPVLSAAETTVCPGSDVTISVAGNLNDATEWIVYTGSCGGTQITTTSTNSFTITDVSTTTTYYVRGEGSSCDDPTCGNITITVEDITAPVPDNAALPDVTGECSVTSLTAPTATDNCVGLVTGALDATLPITTQGTTVVTWTYDDGNGNISTQTQNVIIDDVTNPTFTCPSTATVFFDAYCQITIPDLVSGITNENDNCGTPTLSQSPVAGTVLESGEGIIHHVTITADDGNGNSFSCDVEVTGVPVNPIDIEVVDLGNSCQSGETGSTTTITWDITKIAGTNAWTFDYEIKEGTTTIASATNVSATGNTQLSVDVNNETGQNKTFTISISNVKDACGTSETNSVNNSDSVTLYGVPDTGDINTN
ncbi:MAG TPA: GEVED domain-containing protein [Draconibacterium sp.]|nr:GEVED domain-containing protein [Draconibacterium sp.]